MLKNSSSGSKSTLERSKTKGASSASSEISSFSSSSGKSSSGSSVVSSTFSGAAASSSSFSAATGVSVFTSSVSASAENLPVCSFISKKLTGMGFGVTENPPPRVLILFFFFFLSLYIFTSLHFDYRSGVRLNRYLKATKPDVFFVLVAQIKRVV